MAVRIGGFVLLVSESSDTPFSVTVSGVDSDTALLGASSHNYSTFNLSQAAADAQDRSRTHLSALSMQGFHHTPAVS